jgi:phosphoribosylanthranilate isomerase
VSDVVEVKFCGMTRAGDARAAVELGARYVGVVFAGGPRHLSAAQAGDVLEPVCPPVRRVGVFGDAPADEILEIAARVGLDVLQLHGSAPQVAEQVRAGSGGVIWRVARIAGRELEEHAALFRGSDGVVVDAWSARARGGTGTSFDWDGVAERLRALRGRTPLIVAGGLTPDNVRQAIDLLAPDVVDVSSGIESAPGVKDHGRMRAFMDAVRRDSGER